MPGQRSKGKGSGTAPPARAGTQDRHKLRWLLRKHNKAIAGTSCDRLAQLYWRHCGTQRCKQTLVNPNVARACIDAHRRPTAVQLAGEVVVVVGSLREHLAI